MALINLKEAKKRKTSTTHTSTFSATGSYRSFSFSDISYSSVKKKQRATKCSLYPPPLPSTTNQFPIHTPPSTPYSQRIQKNDLPTTPKSYVQTISKADVEMEIDKRKEDDEKSETPMANHSFRSLPEQYDPITFIEPETPLESTINLPDTTAIANYSNSYYPILLSLHSPRQSVLTTCHTPGCSNVEGPYYNCNNCFNSNAYCQQCIKIRHEQLPFHRIQMWDDKIGCYRQIKWHDLGMVWKLTHEDGTHCTSCNTIRQLQVLHVNGMHNFAYYQCTCLPSLRRQSTAEPTQFLANRLYPATSNAPTSAFTFDVLNLFDTINLTTFANIKQFCDAIFDLTPKELRHCGEVPGRLRLNFHSALRLWRLFKIMMMHGYQHYSDLYRNSIVRGCPTCPQPKINIPDNWHEHPHKQSRTLAKSEIQDPPCFGDSGFFLPYETYHKYTAPNQSARGPKKSEDCSGKAGNPTKDRAILNMKTAGVFAWQCRHGLFKAHGVADVPKGERFDIVDAPLLKIMNDTWESGLEHISVIYDSACRYKVNFHMRCEQNPHTPLDRKHWHRIKPESSFIQWFVNAFHQYSHNPECADNHSLRNSSNIGMVTGEEIETAWSILNNLQYSIREMDAGARADMITAHMLAMNEEKIKKMGDRLINRLLEAEQQYQAMNDEFLELEAGLEEASPGTTRMYRESYEQRGGDQFRPDPTKVKYPTKNETLARLRAEEQKFHSSLRTSVVLLAGQGLELEGKWASLDANKNKNQAWFKREQSLLAETSKHYNEVCDVFPLIATVGQEDFCRVALPSAYSLGQCTDNMYSSFVSAELDLRVGLGHDILHDIRSNVGLLNYYCRKQRREVRGQHELKSVAQSQKRISNKRSWFIQKYLNNWKRIQSLLNLSSLTHKEKEFRLKGLKALSKAEDLSFFTKIDNSANKAFKGTERQLSWIWRISMLEQPGDNCTQSLQELESEWEHEARRLLWLQTFTRLERWKEELLLVREEMRRLNEWYQHYIKSENQKIDSCIGWDDSRVTRGYKALLCENLKYLKLDYEKLPEAIKQCQHYG